jgi:tRNA(Ile)-lysidine synthase TilS/MesJ
MIKKKTAEKTRSIHTIQTIAARIETLYGKEHILKHQIQANEKILVAVSGGADSILTACLLYNFFVQEKYNKDNLFFIHCNH